MAHTKDHNDDDDNDDGIDTESQLAIREAQYQDWLKKCRSSVSDNVISLEAFRSWISYSQAAQSLLKHMAEVVLLGTSNAALIAIDKHDHSSIDGTGGIPSKLLPQLTGKSGRLLASTDCWLLAQQMPVECRATWRLAFSTRYDGDNWQHLSSALLGSGSTLIVIREASSGIKDDANSTSKHLFGAFTKEAWRKSPDFYGSADNFLFTQQASSAIRTFTATSTNDHYQYLNFNTKSLPNGLGMGGQLNYFGLWIGADHFGEGHSKASPLSSTYRSPQLSSSEKFMIEEMEVWCVQERVSDEDDEQQQSSASILDRNPDATALLEMAGRTMYSKQVRDPDMDLDD
ncbi:TLD-domain-containing protein [Syncephalis plumigaleata]|nr:TLD-domain-containing protein [Syncephalis plumigaleata]